MAARALDKMAAAALPPGLIGLGVILLLFGVADLTLYSPDAGLPLAIADAGMGLAFLAFGLRVRVTGIAPEHAHPLMAGVVGATLANVALGIWMGAEPAHSIYLVLAVVGSGSVLLSWRWTVAVCVAASALWVAATWNEPFDWAKTQYALGLFGACCVAMLIVVVRIHTYGNLDKLRSEERTLRQELQVALSTLREHAQRLQAVVKGAPIVLFALDPDGRFRFASGKGLEAIGLTGDELIGRNVHDVYPAASDLAPHFERALRGETSTGPLHAGEQSFLVSWGPMLGPDGGVAGIVGVATVTTDQTRAERELEASRKHIQRQERLAALGTLVAGVAHEINNPLAYMKGNTQVTTGLLESLARDASIPETSRADAQTLLALQRSTLQGIDRLAHISESLRAVAKSGGKARVALDANRLVETALTVAQPRLRAALVVETDLQAAASTEGDEAELCQVVLNLLLNAADELAARPDGRVRVRTRDAAAGVVIEVEDNGRGIDASNHDLIFAPFFTTKPQGTGLGLSISHRIVDDHGGILSFTSRPGSTVFRLQLPAKLSGSGPSSPTARARIP